MQKHRVFWASVFANLLTLVLLPGVAHANHVAVNCPGASLNDVVATLPRNGPNTITVTGTCNENVFIGDFRELTIVAGAGGAKIIGPQDSDAFDIVGSQFIRLVNLEIAGVPGSTPGSAGTGVFINQASNVHINGCDIHDNQGSGVFATRGSLIILLNTNIHNNNPFDGLDVFSNSIADVLGSTIQNNGSPGVLNLGNPASATGGVGVFVQGNSFALFRENNLIQSNADAGIVVSSLSTVKFGAPLSPGTTIQGHNIDGIVVTQGGHLRMNGPALIQGNGAGCSPDTPISCGGIVGTANATLELQSGTISGNHGAGVSLEQGTNLHLNGATISNNSGDGIHLRWISIADFRDFGFGANTITGNGGASVFCDARSLAIGDLQGFSKVQCREKETSR